MSVKVEILKLLKKYDDGKYSNVALNEYLKSSQLKTSEKAFVTEVFYGVIRNVIFCDAVIKTYTDKKVKKQDLLNILRISVYQIFYMESDSAGVIWEGVEIAKNSYDKNVAGFINGVLRTILREKDKITANFEKNEKYNLIYSYPKWIYKKLKKEYPENYLEIMKSYKQTPYLSVRVNKIRWNIKEFREYIEKNGIEVIKEIDTVFYLKNSKIIESDIFKEGKVIIQDASSYIAGKNLGAKNSHRVLDCCAAPGGKSAVIAEGMGNGGEILALDIYDHKLKLMEENFIKFGIKNIEMKNLDAVTLESSDIGEFDKIIADVPCSGFGVIRKKPEALYNKKREDIDNLVELQRNILEKVSKLLKVGGHLIYSTCTILKEENSENIEWFLKENPNFESVKLEIPENVSGDYDEVGGFLVNYKEKIADGFYLVKLMRNA